MGSPEEKEEQDKLLSFSDVLQKFGLDIITKLGKNNSKIQTLIDKVDQLNEATIAIKGLIPNLNRIIENQDKVMKDLDLIKSLVQKSQSKATEVINEIDRDTTVTDKKTVIIEKLNVFASNLNSFHSIREIQEGLTELKREVFEFTGGHKVLYEILKTINNLSNENINISEVKKDVVEKINFWKNKV
ncbi:MAG: hypothetical protein ACTSR8_14820 [Promethearchaeota archaeon]